VVAGAIVCAAVSLAWPGLARATSGMPTAADPLSMLLLLALSVCCRSCWF